MRKLEWRLAAAGMLCLACAVLCAASEYTPPDKGAALDSIKKIVADAAKSGKKIEIWLSPFGSLQKYELVKADDKVISIKVGDNVWEHKWEKVSPAQAADVAKACLQGDGD